MNKEKEALVTQSQIPGGDEIRRKLSNLEVVRPRLGQATRGGRDGDVVRLEGNAVAVVVVVEL